MCLHPCRVGSSKRRSRCRNAVRTRERGWGVRVGTVLVFLRDKGVLSNTKQNINSSRTGLEWEIWRSRLKIWGALPNLAITPAHFIMGKQTNSDPLLFIFLPIFLSNPRGLQGQASPLHPWCSFFASREEERGANNLTKDHLPRVKSDSQDGHIPRSLRQAEVLFEGCAARSSKWINMDNIVRVPVHGLNFPTTSQRVTLIRPTALASLPRLVHRHIHLHLLPATNTPAGLLLQLRNPTRQTRFFRPTILPPLPQPLVAPHLSSPPPS